MLTRERVDELLQLQGKAFEILMWLADEATNNPHLLGPQAVVHLGRASSAAAWVEIHAPKFRIDQLTPGQLRAFSALFSSFFATSFRVEHVFFDDKLLESRVKVGLGPDTPSHSGLSIVRSSRFATWQGVRSRRFQSRTLADLFNAKAFDKYPFCGPTRGNWTAARFRKGRDRLSIRSGAPFPMRIETRSTPR
jgi:hypothetical protein